jgi:hypothetical protein
MFAVFLLVIIVVFVATIVSLKDEGIIFAPLPDSVVCVWQL